jgi:hypothetical protein
MSLEELLKQKKLLKKDYSQETPEEREARLKAVQEYQEANPEEGAEEGDFSDYAVPVKGALKGGVKAVIRRMSTSKPPQVKTAQDIKNLAQGSKNLNKPGEFGADRTEQEALDFIREEGFDSVGSPPKKLPTGVLRDNRMNAPGQQLPTIQYSKDGYNVKTKVAEDEQDIIDAEAFSKMARTEIGRKDPKYQALIKKLIAQGKKQYE